MHTDMSMLSLIMQASFMVQLVLLALLVVSVVSWTLIIHKWKVLKKAKQDANQFETQFWSGTDLVDLYRNLSTGGVQARGMAGIFEAGFREYAKLHKQAGIVPETILESAQRAMRVRLNREIDHAESAIPFLATVGSTSPYVGLFGTVWGIMNSFRALGQVEQATMAMVAPGIAEALIATAMGLFAAIPAVIAYNRFAYSVERLEARYDAFMEEFSNLLYRQVNS